MFFNQKTSIGLDIRDDKINVIQLRKTLTGSKIIKSDTAYIPKPLPEDKEKRHLVIGETIKDLFKRCNIKRRKVVIAIPSNHALVKIIELPLLKEALIKKALRYEIEEHIPSPLNEVIYDYLILKNKDGKSRVLIAVVRKELIYDYLGILEKAGLEPSLVDVTSLTNLNYYLSKSAEIKNGRVLLINLESKYAEIGVLKDGDLEFIKTLLIKPEQDKDEILLHEIKAILEYLPGHIDKLQVYGEGVERKFQSLQNELKINTLMINPLFNPPNLNSSLLTPVGLAFRGFEKELGVDLSPFKEKREEERRKRGLINTGILLGLILVLLYGLFYLILKQKEVELQKVELRLREVQPMVNQTLLKKKEFERLENELRILGNIVKEQTCPLDLLKELCNVLPKDFWIQDLTLDGDNLELRGISFTSSSKLIPILETSPYFKDVGFSGSTVRDKMEDGRDVDRFKVKAKIVTPD